jgi:hypothetical protein
MTDIRSRARRRRAGYFWLAACPAAVGAIAMVIATQPAVAATTVGLGTAGSYAVLAGTTVTNTGLSLISGNLGVSPGTAVTGFPPGIVTGGTIHAADANAAGAQADLTTAYNDAAGQTPTATVSVIGAGQTLAPGVYNATSSLEVGGSLTLNAEGNPNAVFIFQAGSTLTTDTGTRISLTNGAQACNVFWQVGSSATLNTSTSFQGTILALTSISVLTGDTITGRALARNGGVTLDTDTITRPRCTTTTPPTTPPTTTPPTGTGPSTTPPTTTPPTGTGPGGTGPGGTGPGGTGPGGTGPGGTGPGGSGPTGTGPGGTGPGGSGPTGTGPGGTGPGGSGPIGTGPGSSGPGGSGPTGTGPGGSGATGVSPAPAPTPVGTTFPVTG